MKKRSTPGSAPPGSSEGVTSKGSIDQAVICPVYGAIAVEEKCKVICRSETCYGRM